MKIATRTMQHSLLLALCFAATTVTAETAPASGAAVPQVYVVQPAAGADDRANGHDGKQSDASAQPAGTTPANGVTADDAKNDSVDLGLMQQIRRSIVADSTLSTAAQNISIIAQDGKVTLKGTVKSDTERQNILNKASAAAGANNVNDALILAKADKATGTTPASADDAAIR